MIHKVEYNISLIIHSNNVDNVFCVMINIPTVELNNL